MLKPRQSNERERRWRVVGLVVALLAPLLNGGELNVVSLSITGEGAGGGTAGDRENIDARRCGLVVEGTARVLFDVTVLGVVGCFS